MGNPYFLPAGFSPMSDFGRISMLLRKAYRILNRGVLPEPKGITIITETPISPDDQKAFGFIPFEEL